MEPVRQAIAGLMERLFVDPDRPGFTDATSGGNDLPEPGPIPLDSPARRVHGDPCAMIGGVRALLLQTLHPDACYVVHQHSVYEGDPLGRLRRTAHFLGATIHGSAADAQQAIDRVNTIHRHITGNLPDGRPYRADDPHLIGWVHATEVESFLWSYQRYGAEPLDAAEADRYVNDMAAIGNALGGADLPTTTAELRATLDRYRLECRPTAQSRDITRFIFAPELPLAALSFYPAIFAAAVAGLPEWARQMLLLPLPPLAEPLVLHPTATMLLRAMRWAGATPG